ncbi:MAG: hypothetical protein QF681_03350 [Vicinamibacterales bacterium]|jgi:hypothetical protein|nr:hypothetical protein [Vicinamibacterales bacterium]
MTAVRWALAAMLAAAVVSGLDLLAHPHGEAWWHHLPGFDLVYGFVGCVAIVVGSKALGKVWLQRPERFYEDREHGEDGKGGEA